MPEYIAAGIIFQTIILERDEAGNITTEHIMPPAKAHWPYVDIPETVNRQLEEFARPLQPPHGKP